MIQLETIRTVRVVILDPQDRFILFRRPVTSKFRAGDWDLPGGKVEDHETLEAAAVREVYEETGASIDEMNLKSLYESRDIDCGRQYTRRYFQLLGHMSVEQMSNLTEHDSIMLAPKAIALGATCFQPQREAMLRTQPLSAA